MKHPFVAAIFQATNLYFTVWKKGAGLFLGVYAITEVFNQYFAYYEKLLLQSEAAGSNAVFIARTGNFLATMLGDATMILLVPALVHALLTNQPVALVAHFRKYLKPFAREFLRVLGQIILWGLFLILPGIYKQARLYFVPFVIMFDDRYDRGEIDPLKISHDLSRKYIFELLLLTVLTIVIEVYLTNLKLGFSPLTSPLPFAGTFLLSIAVDVLVYIWTYFVYQNIKKNLAVAAA